MLALAGNFLKNAGGERVNGKPMQQNDIDIHTGTAAVSFHCMEKSRIKSPQTFSSCIPQKKVKRVWNKIFWSELWL